MGTVDQQAQPRQATEDFEQTFESIKVERNSKGFNYSYRVARHEGESWEQVFRTIDMLEQALRMRYGDNR